MHIFDHSVGVKGRGARFVVEARPKLGLNIRIAFDSCEGLVPTADPTTCCVHFECLRSQRIHEGQSYRTPVKKLVHPTVAVSLNTSYQPGPPNVLVSSPKPEMEISIVPLPNNRSLADSMRVSKDFEHEMGGLVAPLSLDGVSLDLRQERFCSTVVEVQRGIRIDHAVTIQEVEILRLSGTTDRKRTTLIGPHQRTSKVPR